MKIELVRVVSRNPYIAELSILENSLASTIGVFADWHDGSDYANERMQTAIERSGEARDFSYWLRLYGLTLAPLSKSPEVFKKGIRKRLELLLAAFQKNSFDGVHLNVVLINGDPQLVVFPTAEEVDPHEHRIQFLRQEWISEARRELESILGIVKPGVSLSKFILANGRDFYFDIGENPHGLRNTWATTKWTKDILTHVVDELLSDTPVEPHEILVDRMIPHEYRSRPMPKKEAINFVGWPTHCKTERQALHWFNQCIKDGEFPCEMLSKKSYVFDVRPFPVKAQREMRCQ